METEVSELGALAEEAHEQGPSKQEGYATGADSPSVTTEEHAETKAGKVGPLILGNL